MGQNLCARRDSGVLALQALTSATLPRVASDIVLDGSSCHVKSGWTVLVFCVAIISRIYIKAREGQDGSGWLQCKQIVEIPPVLEIGSVTGT